MTRPITTRNLAIAVAGAALCLAANSASAQGGGDGSSTQKQSAGEPSAKQDDKVFCRTEKVIGSRAKKRKTCLTKAQWEEVARRGNAFARSVVESGRSGMWDLEDGG